MDKHIVITGVEPAHLSLRHPLGINLDLRLVMKSQNGTPVDPTLSQFVLLPRSLGGVRPYDMETVDAINGIGRVQVPGIDLQDDRGYNLELYSRKPNDVSGDPPLPTGLLAIGNIAMQGAAHVTYGPMGLINVPVVVGPPGPAGAMGATGPTGQRGSVWTTGPGAPGTSPDNLPGDMYLDESNGDVYRFDGAVWVLGSF